MFFCIFFLLFSFLFFSFLFSLLFIALKIQIPEYRTKKRAGAFFLSLECILLASFFRPNDLKFAKLATRLALSRLAVWLSRQTSLFTVQTSLLWIMDSELLLHCVWSTLKKCIYVC